ncbi:MAG: homocysteine S-methyltransferase family protein [Clostridia bacterium]|nr:homocysteine S-methyltransferase family protein [Clostridia bacterium]
MKFLDFLKTNTVLLDGGMGTLLQARGLLPGESPERWSITPPEDVRAIHRAYFEAGSHVVNTNTFGANLLHFSAAELDVIIKAAVENARVARESARAPQEKYIALDIGPCGRLLRPYGDFDFEEAVTLFRETVRRGVAAGVDLITIETMNDSYETKAALLAVREETDLPVIVTNAYGEDGKLMTGATPAAMVAMLEGMGANAIGANCSLGPRGLVPVIEELLATSSLPVVLKPNAGLPIDRNGKTEYDISAEAFADEVAALCQRGVRVAGGCCGTTPDYIHALAARVAGIEPLPIENKTDTVVSSYTHAVHFGGMPLLIGERINPTGKKRLKQALMEGDTDYILNEGVRQQEAGVQLLDVNVGLPGIDETAVLTHAVCELQAIIDLPLVIDTASPAAMEAALRRYNGKPLLNSVNGKEESMHAIFPLMKKYGGAVIALTLDEDGIPETAEGRVAIARRILDTAATYGIDKKDVIFDTLTMTVSAEPQAAAVTLAALRTIRRELGCHTSLGVSNVSFGLPAREAINSTFFALAMENGLSAAILNPHSPDMMRAWYSFRALHGMDESCADYIACVPALQPAAPSATQPSAAPQAAAEAGSALQKAIARGMHERAAELTRACLTTRKGLCIVNEEIIPALDAVGRGFEEKTVYLPQLLMAAEAAKAAFTCIKDAMAADEASQNTRGPIVIATVQGDIHDIGKNIVKLLLENYGFAVSDLGKDVPPEEIVAEVLRLHAPIAALSALMTTTVPAMEETIRQLRAQAPWCNTIVGGAVLNREYAARIGADCYAKDAMEAVRCAEQLVKE